ncbi:MAG: methylmalonyl Co-A mutase-associated GTPase MeaB [Flavobacteriaceae bacterium]|nr:methylmalonyl Co-A mutase-associated GTPase MeaB [Flavobacteriaceae bacterium]
MNNINKTSVDEFVTHILNNNISYLSRAITLIESNNSKHQEKATQILEKCLSHASNSIRIGITGVPGVGKSTFIESFGKYLTSIGKKVAVLAIDPSSSIQKGSILGDKTRMSTLALDDNAFIRPSPSGNSLGGVARKTREAITLCEAAGFDIIIIETVGVGQSETTVHSMVDFFLLLKLANAGDELQGIKRGIIEMADTIAINKADGNAEKEAKIAKSEFSRALHLYPKKENNWIPKVLTCSALNNVGIDSIYTIIKEYIALTKENGSFLKKRSEQNKNWLFETINNELKNQFYKNSKVQNLLNLQLKRIENKEINPFQAAKEILKIKR